MEENFNQAVIYNSIQTKTGDHRGLVFSKFVMDVHTAASGIVSKYNPQLA